MNSETQTAYLIVNADDYGYFRCVSRGILEAASRGIVTATGVVANQDGFEEQIGWLRESRSLDVGVHLNLTAGAPISDQMRKKCSRWSGVFPGKYAMSFAVLAGWLRTEDVADEWGAQINRCIAAGLQPSFLNSHEHIHMLPPLSAVAFSLAKQYGIQHVRLTTAERPLGLSPGALLRNGIMTARKLLVRDAPAAPVAAFLGLDASGRLDERYLQRILPTLHPGRVYELMCHPGKLDRDEVHDPRLLAYHDWEGELSALTQARVKDLLVANGVTLIGYRDLEISAGRLFARPALTVSAPRH